MGLVHHERTNHSDNLIPVQTLHAWLHNLSICDMLANRNPSCLNLPCEKSLAYESVDQPLSQEIVEIFCVSFFFFFGYNIMVCVCARIWYILAFFFLDL